MSTLGPEEQLDLLSEEFVARIRAGERPSIEAYVERHPELATGIRKLFPMLQRMEGFKSEFVGADDPAGTELGEYRLVREIGRGGMGVVYEAHQETLDRRVALKVLPANLVRDPRYLERFRLEARAAGRLQHPNVVPVIGIGEHDGIHYFAMQYIEGRGLDALVADIRERRDAASNGGAPEADALVDRLLTSSVDASSSAGAPTDLEAPGTASTAVGRTWFDNAARLVLQAAEGVAAAHARAILHRDIKPGNLLLDDTGKVWITDFGLCKEEGDASLTRTGDVLGTLRYMPPERLKGESDVQGDVYGLGITLHELVTLRPAFPEDDHAELLARLSSEDLPKPRSIDPDIPRDLAAIVRKATARDRTQRYATAEALASDLRAFIERRPIAARPPSFGYHLRSAIRRHRALTATLVLAVLAIVVSTVYYVTSLKQKEADTRLQSYIAGVAAADAAYLAGNPASARRHLDAAPSELRGWEWHHVDSQLDRSLRTTPVGAGRGWGVAYSPDGRWIAVSTTDGVRVLDDQLQTVRARLAVHRSPREVAWSPDGTHLAVVSSGGVEIWAWPAPKRVEVFRTPPGGQNVAWLPDGRRLAAGGEDGALRVYALGHEAPLATLPTRSRILSVDAHPTEPLVATGTWDGHVAVWNVQTKTRAWSRRVSGRGLHGIAFVGTDLLATPTESPHVHVWNTKDGRHHWTIADRFGPGANDVVASEDGRKLIIATQLGLSAYDVATWDRIVSWGIVGEVRGMALHPLGGRIATVGLDNRVREWGTELDADPTILNGHVDDVLTVAYAPSGAFLVTAGIGVARCWDAHTGEQRRVWIGNRWTPMHVAVSPDSRTVAVGDRSGDVVLWDVASDTIRKRLMGHGDWMGGLAFAPDGQRVFVTGEGGELHVWDVAAAKRTARETVAEARGTALAVHPDGRWIALGDERGTVWLLDGKTYAPIRSIEAHDGRVSRLVFDARSSRLLSCSMDGTLRVWSCPSGERLHEVRAGPMHTLALSPDGKRIAAGGRDSAVRLWDAETLELVFTRGGLYSWVNGLAFSPDGSRLALATSAPYVMVLDTRPLRERKSADRGTLEVRRQAVTLVESLDMVEASYERVIERLREGGDLQPDVREAALREAHRRHGSEEGLIAYLWRAVAPRGVGLIERLIACAVAQDLQRAAGHRNRQDRRRQTLVGVLQIRTGQADIGVANLQEALRFNEGREPYLMAVDLAFLAMGHAAMARREPARRALARLEAYVAERPGLLDGRLKGFREEARRAVGGLPK